eukprot:scaffold997_cov250-Ochromonas_danica.AAC.13
MLYIHIGPHKTGSTHIQTVLTLLRANLSQNGVCWPGEHIKFFHPLADRMSKHERFNRSSELFAGINHCLANYPVTIISSETFVYLKPATIVHLRNLFASADVKIHIVSVYRDWLLRLYSAYGEFAKKSYTHLCTFHYFFSIIYQQGFRKYNSNDKGILKKYEDVFGYDALTVIDHAGAIAVGKDIATILVCEILKVPCEGLSDVFHRRENVSKQKRSYEVLVLLRQMAWARGCAVNTSYDGDIPRLNSLAQECESYLDILPTYESRFEPLKELSINKRKDFDSRYENRVWYRNPDAALPSLMNFSLRLIDYDMLYGNFTLQQLLKTEVSKLIARKVFINCIDG